ncbi:hypothetical protein F0562_014190 [Nyssa sinensis]|uniref:PB1 domain-containing protein n=1 Tax=Nyssa sinensis TaxID=561372 RepID=A0A5J4ZMU3_9ASTE|nr:hypothetical protein F0562_014190 [Nyssa sinensis]
MTSNHPTNPDSGATDSVISSPPSDCPPNQQRLDDDSLPRVRFMCSFGGKILPRPHDNQLRYVGGDTRIVSVHRHTTFSSLLHKLHKLSGITNISVKYQLPNEDLDALITVTTDEDVENMIEEYDRLAHSHIHSNTARLRLFLFSTEAESRNSSISSLLNGSTKREHWFLDALNGGAGPGSGLERGPSEASSIFSEMPDYLFGLENSDEQPREPKLKSRPIFSDNVSISDPGSPAPNVSSPFCSTSSSLAPPCVPSFPDLPPVKTKPDKPNPGMELKEAQVEGFVETSEPPVSQLTGYAGEPMWQYVSDPHYPGTAVQPIPVYYVPGQVPTASFPVQHLPTRAQYVQQFHTTPGQIPVGFRQTFPGMSQVYSEGVRPTAAMDPYDMSARAVPDGMNPPPVYYGVRNAGVVPPYPGMVMPVGEEQQGNVGRISQS